MAISRKPISLQKQQQTGHELQEQKAVKRVKLKTKNTTVKKVI